MSSKRIIVGPEAMRVECQGVVSETRPLTGRDGPAEVSKIGAALWETIRPFVSWKVWVRHRMRMALQRSMTASIMAAWPARYYPGPRPDIIAAKPWDQAKHGEILFALPHGVVARLLRENGA